MKSIGKTVFDVSLMAREALSLNWTLDGSDAEMAYPPSGGIPRDMYRIPEIHRAVIEIGKIRGQEPLNVMINKLRPLVKVPIHRDWIKPTRYQKLKPTVERWHLPLLTNIGAIFWHERGCLDGYHFPLGEWMGPIPYWLKHCVYNSGTSDRIHLVVDLDTPNPIGQYEEDIEVFQT